MDKRNLKGIAAGVLLACLAVAPTPASAQGSGHVREKYVNGVLEYQNSSGGVIYKVDPSTKTLTIPSGSALSVASESFSLTVRASTNIGIGDLVYLSSYNATDGAFVAAIADADVAGADAQYVATAAITSGATGLAYRAGTVTMDTQGSTVGNPVYLTITGTTTNTLSLSAPSGVDDRVQIVGRVISVAASGTVAINLTALPATIITATQIRDESIASADILNATIVAADISSTADIARSQLITELAAAYGIPIASIRSDAGAALTAAETAGTFDVTYGTNTILANGEVTDNETETSVAWFQFVLPAEYVAAGAVTIRLPCALIATGAAVDNASTVDVAVFEQSDAGAVGSDLSTTTAAATFAALDTWYAKDFVITATGLVAGDVLNVKVTSAIVDSEAGAGTLVFNLAPPKVLISIKG